MLLLTSILREESFVPAHHPDSEELSLLLFFLNFLNFI